MAIPSGLASQWGVASETSYGLPVTVTRFHPFINESLAQEPGRLESEAIIAGARVLRSAQWAPGEIVIGGDIQTELFQQGLGVLFTHMFGAVTSTSSGGVGTHTYTPGDLTNQSFTSQFGRPTTAGTVIPFTYAGCKVASWEIGLAATEIATLGLTLVAQSVTDVTALAAASYLTGADDPFTFVDGTVTIASSTACVREITIAGDNMLSTERRCIGQRVIDQPIESGSREYTGTISIEFSNTAMYHRFINGTEASILLSLSASASAQARVTMNARFDGVTPNVGGKDLLVTDVPYKCVASTTQDSSAITAVLVNSQTTP